MAKEKGRSTSVGGVHVDVTADTEGLDQNLDSAQRKVEEFADTTATETQKAGNSFSAMTDRITGAIGKQLGAYTRLFASVTGVVAVFTLLLAVVKKVGDAYFRTADSAKQLEVRMNAVEAATERYIQLVTTSIPPGEDPLALKAMLARLVELQTEIAKTQEELDAFVISGASANRESQLRERVSELRAEEKKTIDLSEAFKDRAVEGRKVKERKEREDATRERIAQIERESRILGESLLNPIEQAKAAAIRAQEDIEKMIADAEDERLKESLRKQLEVVAKVGAARIAALREAERKAEAIEAKLEQRRLQAIEKQSEAFADAVTRSLRDQLNSSSSYSNTLLRRLVLDAEQMINSIEHLTNNIRG